MSRMRVHNPVTGEVLEYPIPMRWTPQAKWMMRAGAATLLFFGYFANEFFNNGWDVWGSMFCAFFGVVVLLMYRFYKLVRFYSNVYAQCQAMSEEHERAIAELAKEREGRESEDEEDR